MKASREIAAVAAFFACLTIILTWPLIQDATTAFSGGLWDPMLVSWTVAWGADRLLHGLQGFWSPPVFYPYPNTLSYSEHLLGIAILVAPLRWLGASPILTYNAAYFFSYVLAGCGAFLLARELTGRRDAAVLAGLAFAFCPYRVEQQPHLQMLMSGWMPLGMWALHRFLSSGSLAWLAAFWAFTIVQVLSNSYFGFMLALPLGAIVVAHLATSHALPWKKAGWLASSALIALVAVSPILAAYWRTWATLDLSRGEIIANSADLATYLHTAAPVWAGRWLPGIPQGEGNLFPGLTVLGLTLAAVFLPKSRDRRLAGIPVVRLYGAIAIAAIVLSLGPEPRAWGRVLLSNAPYRWLEATIPGFELMRVPARFGMVAMLALAVLAARGAQRLLAPLEGRSAILVTTLLGVAILVEGYGPSPLETLRRFYRSGERQAYGWLQRQPPGAALELPLGALSRIDNDLVYQFHTLTHSHPIVNGVTRREMPLQLLLTASSSPLSDPSRLPEGIRFLQSLGVKYVLLSPTWYRNPPLGDATQRFFNDSPAGVTDVQRFGSVTVATLDSWKDDEPGVANLQPIPRSAFQIRSSDEEARLGNAFDGEPGTRWLTGRPQQGDEWIEVELDRERQLARIDLIVTERSFFDYPRALHIETASEADEPRTVFRDSTLPLLGRAIQRDPTQPRLMIFIPQTRTKRVWIRQTASDRTWYWSADEIVLLEGQL